MHTSGFAAIVAFSLMAVPLCAQVASADLYPNLQRTLQLTPDQWNRIAAEARAFQSFLNGKPNA